MPRTSVIDVAKKHLFDDAMDLYSKYDNAIVNRLLRIRALYTWYIANPTTSDRDFITKTIADYSISKQQAYSDLGILKALIPNFHEASREFHRYRANEMLLETYKLAKARKDTKSMERAASSYARINKVDLEDEKKLPFDLIVVQPFTPTVDPSVLGLKPIPNLRRRIHDLYEKYSKESIDILDVDFEEADLLENEFFPKPEDDNNSSDLLPDDYKN